MKKTVKRIMLVTVLVAGAFTAACTGNIGVGLNVGVPIGDHGYLSIGTNRWR